MQPLKFEIGQVISYTLLGMWLLIHGGINVKQTMIVQKAPTWWLYTVQGMELNSLQYLMIWFIRTKNIT